MSSDITSTITQTRRWPPILIGVLLLLTGFLVWTTFSLLPSVGHGASRVREAWDTASFWYVGLPVMVAAQALAGAFMGGGLSRQPLWTLGGLLAAVIIVHPGGAGFGLLPLDLILIGVPGYLLLLSAAAIGRKLGDRLLD